MAHSRIAASGGVEFALSRSPIPAVAPPADDKLPLTVPSSRSTPPAQIGPCLASVAFADEVLVVDSGSTDDTVEIARRHGARVETKEWLGFGRQKQHAVSSRATTGCCASTSTSA